MLSESQKVRIWKIHCPNQVKVGSEMHRDSIYELIVTSSYFRVQSIGIDHIPLSFLIVSSKARILKSGVHQLKALSIFF